MTVLCLAATVLSAADLPYAGKWKFNVSKSDLGETTVTYAQLPSGEMQSTADGQSYKFKIDGKEYLDPYGNMDSWKAVDANTWQVTSKLNGKVIETDTLKVDGNSLIVNSKAAKATGGTNDSTIVYQRVSGTSGLAGKWKTKNYQANSPTTMEMTPSGSDGLTFKIVDEGIACEAKFDNADHPCVGPTVAPGWTIMIAKSGPRALEMTTKRNGQTLYKTTYTVSADGKSLTETGGAAGVSEKVKVIYDRQ
jgi:hypothetical protein